MSPDGIILVDKPSGLTSHDVVHKVRKWLNIRAVGHCGTLDPLATGLLVLLVGKATKVSQYILGNDKSYEVIVQLGAYTDSDDSTGNVTESYALDLILGPESKSLLRTAVMDLQGTMEIPIPRFSAKKMQGKKLYELARKNVDFVPPTKAMSFHNVQLLNDLSKGDCDRVHVSMDVSKGSFVRSWARLLGERIGVGGHVAALRRTHSQPYSVEKSLELDELTALDPQDLPTLDCWVPLAETLESWPMVPLDGPEEKLVRNGQLPRRLERFLEIEYGGKGNRFPGVKLTSRQTGSLLSLVRHTPPYEFKISRVFPA